MNLTKRWNQAGGSIELVQNFDLDRNIKSLLLPSASLTKFSSALFPAHGRDSTSAGRWYNFIYYSFNSTWQNSVSKARDTSGVDSVRHFLTADYTGNINLNQKILGALNFAPSIGLRESWYYVFQTNQSQNAGILTEKPARAGSINFSLGAGTNLYGTFPITLFGLQGLRHTFTPSVSFLYQPKFDQHPDLRSFTGVGTGAAKSQLLNFSAGNVVVVKTGSDKKLELFNLNFSSNYDFLAPSRKLGLLNTVFRSRAVPNVDFQFNSVHDFYDPAGAKLNFLNPRLTVFSITTNLYYQQKAYRPSDSASAESSHSEVREGLRVNLSHYYSENRPLGSIAKNHWVSLGAEFWATRNWKITYAVRYDFIEKQTAEQSFEIYRDLHCWEGRISWVPSGFREGFYFRINIKALPEIKFEKGGAGLGTPFY